MPTPEQQKSLLISKVTSLARELQELIENEGDLPEGSGVYVVKCQGFYKIGITYNIKSRLNTLGCGNPYKIELVLYRRHKKFKEIEKKLHEIFLSKRHSREWFKLEEDDIGFIKDFIREYEQP